ncbi:MAG: VOC family protein [Thermomicrobiales bacterium]
MQLDHVSVPVPAGKIDEVHSFYGGVIELEKLPVRDEVRDVVAWYRVGTGQLHLIANSGWKPPREHAMLPEAGPHFALIVENVDWMRERLDRQNVENWESEVEIPNRRRLFCRDPFGNIIELVELLPTPKSEET